MFLEFLDCMQSVRVLSNLELEKPVTVFILFNVCSWSVFRAIRSLVLSFQIKIRGKWQEEDWLRLILNWLSAKQPCSIYYIIFSVVLICSYVWYIYTNILRQMIEMLICSLRRLLLIKLAMKECSWQMWGMGINGIWMIASCFHLLAL